MIDAGSDHDSNNSLGVNIPISLLNQVRLLNIFMLFVQSSFFVILINFITAVYNFIVTWSRIVITEKSLTQTMVEYYGAVTLRQMADSPEVQFLAKFMGIPDLEAVSYLILMHLQIDSQSHQTVFFISFLAILIISLSKYYLFRSERLHHNANKEGNVNKVKALISELIDFKQIQIGQETSIKGRTLFVSLAHLKLLFLDKKESLKFVLHHELFHFKALDTFIGYFISLLMFYNAFIVSMFLWIPLAAVISDFIKLFVEFNVLTFLASLLLSYKCCFVIYAFLQRTNFAFIKLKEHFADLYAFNKIGRNMDVVNGLSFSNESRLHPKSTERTQYLTNSTSRVSIEFILYFISYWFVVWWFPRHTVDSNLVLFVDEILALFFIFPVLLLSQCKLKTNWEMSRSTFLYALFNVTLIIVPYLLLWYLGFQDRYSSATSNPLSIVTFLTLNIVELSVLIFLLSVIFKFCKQKDII